MTDTRILVVEDDADINEVVCARLARAGYGMTSAYSGSEARMVLERESFDLIVTDLMLPGVPGERLIADLREHGSGAPIIVISARGTVGDRVSVLAMGADDYLVKPFDLDELAARVESQLRGRSYAVRGAAPGAAPARDGDGGRMVRGRWTIDSAARAFTVDGEPVPLTNIEFNIVELLAAHPNQVFTKQQVYELCWGESYLIDDNTVTAHISKIRAKLKASGTDSYIRTVWGLGVKLAVE
ncbi:response regulator transcription factor [Bifidobacterium eulemuris]|uniref:DNA-binding response regulator n=1 Tax=Bifidobacterium eulemuris TaxID=1765219 RepID=A0A261GA84_9BIFI|nr:response regulator transcription factor [Bifidobacterium eulemuris]OZG68328.1 DNA-binding response regulator [Bifidobacterium eulemuris]QOL31622.1 response regulator transcription factor [Bifidobacterium eulemuris]